jgi:hypothetical protein
MPTPFRSKGYILLGIVALAVPVGLIALAVTKVALLVGTPEVERDLLLLGLAVAEVLLVAGYFGRDLLRRLTGDFTAHGQPGLSVRLDAVDAPAGSPPPSDVFISASAPRVAAAGSAFVVRVAAYVESLREPTLDLLRHLAPTSERYVDLRRCRWAHGAHVRVRMTLVGSAAAPLEEEFIWRNASNLVDFPVQVPAFDAPDTLVPRLEVFVEDLRVATILLTVEVGLAPAWHRRVTVTAEPARTAFASYARRDRRRVLDRVASLRIASGLEVWLDHLSLVPSRRWKEEVERMIGESDLFLLFWSPHAKRSRWVTWEWKLALARKPRDRFQVHPLAYAAPPPELEDLQVDDVLMTLRGAPAPG